MPRGYRADGRPLGGWPDGKPPLGGRPSRGARRAFTVRLGADEAEQVLRLAAKEAIITAVLAIYPAAEIYGTAGGWGVRENLGRAGVGPVLGEAHTTMGAWVDTLRRLAA